MSGVHGGGVNTAGFILVLFILLVIIIRGVWY
ncbi:dihydroorotate dehydrogenase [Paenibacillus sp. MMO-177]